MWNYNLDEMPKDGTEIVVWFESDSLINETEEYETFVLTLLYHEGTWLKKISQTECEDMEYAKCWTYAPKTEEQKNVEL